MLELEELSQGKHDEEFEELKEKLRINIIPRLLRPLESGGRKVTPCLIHSDLWPGNCMPDADTDEIMIFDSCAYWGIMNQILEAGEHRGTEWENHS